MHYLKSQTNSLYYKHLGLTNPAIFIHGSCLNSDMWNDSFDIVAHQRLAIVYDQRGYGKSRIKSKTKFSHENDLFLLHKHLNLEKADLIGLSSGAQIALDFCLRYPNNVSSLTLVSPAISGVDKNFETAEIDAKILETIKSGKYKQTLQLVYNHPVFAPAINNPRCNYLLRKIINGHNFQTVSNNPPADESYNANSRLSEIKVPPLIIIGQNDSSYFHMTSDILKNGIAHSKLETIKHAGHMVNMEQPERFNQELLCFLKTH